MDSSTLTNLMRMGSKVQKFLEIKVRVKEALTGSSRTAIASKSTDAGT
jgi:hypothetical protein